MPYGIQVQTYNGLQDVANLRFGRVRARYAIGSTSGSLWVGSAMLSGSISYVQVKDGGNAPWVSRSLDTISWTPAPGVTTNQSSSFDILIIGFT